MLNNTRASLLIQGAFHGFAAWMAYAVVEFVLSSIAPCLKSDHVFTWFDWKVTIILFAAYAVIGLLAGMLTGLTIGMKPRRQEESVSIRLQHASTLTLVVISFLNSLVFSWNTALPMLPNRTCALVSALLASVLILGFSARRPWNALHNPWVASIIILLPPQFADQVPLSSMAAKIAATALLVVILVVVCVALSRGFRVLWPSQGRIFALRQVAFLSVATVLAFGSVPFLNHRIDNARREVKFNAPVSGLTNIILVTLDTVNAQHLSVYGYSRQTTPILKKLSSEATLYTNAFSTEDMTLASHASIFTGLYPREHGAQAEPTATGLARASLLWLGAAARPLASEFETVAEILSAKGYTTLGNAANWAYLDPRWGVSQGFAFYKLEKPLRPFVAGREFFVRTAVRELLSLFLSTYGWDLEYTRAADLNDDNIELLKRMKREQRSFFLFANYMDAHLPYVPPRPFDTLFPGRDASLVLRRYIALENDVVTLKRTPTERERRHLVSQYDGGIAYMDSELGRLFAQLRALGLYDDTLIIITADHGEAFGERNLMEHGISVYQNQIHVPLIIKYPRQREAQVIASPVSLIDLAPTILDVLGYPARPKWHGQSLRKPLDENREILSFCNPLLIVKTPRMERSQVAILRGPLKYVRSTSGDRELFDLSKDPYEERNLLNQDSPASANLQASLVNWLKALKPYAAAKVVMDAAKVKELHSLGYVQ
jgi:arylsulfatase A-like enzyme